MVLCILPHKFTKFIVHSFWEFRDLLHVTIIFDMSIYKYCYLFIYRPIYLFYIYLTIYLFSIIFFLKLNNLKLKYFFRLFKNVFLFSEGISINYSEEFLQGNCSFLFSRHWSELSRCCKNGRYRFLITTLTAPIWPLVTFLLLTSRSWTDQRKKLKRSSTCKNHATFLDVLERSTIFSK